MIAAPYRPRAFLEERLILIANHLLASEPVATERLRRHLGRSICVQIQARLPLQRQAAATPAWRWQVTAAGLLEVPADGAPDAGGLTVEVDLQEPFAVLRRLLGGQRPPMTIQGDAAFAADVAWLIDNLRWDVEDDLARVVGGPQAHLMVKWLRMVRDALAQLLGLTGGLGGLSGDRAGSVR